MIPYCFRFLNNSKLAKPEREIGNLHINELEHSVKFLIKLSPAQTFDAENLLLKVEKFVQSTSRLISLNPFLDTDGILRVGGRLNYSNDEK